MLRVRWEKVQPEHTGWFALLCFFSRTRKNKLYSSIAFYWGNASYLAGLQFRTQLQGKLMLGLHAPLGATAQAVKGFGSNLIVPSLHCFFLFRTVWMQPLKIPEEQQMNM